MIQNFISKLSPKEKRIFYIAIIFVVVAFLDRLFLGPVMSRLHSIDSEIEQQKNAIKSDLRFLSYKDRILKENEDFGVYYTKKAQTEEEIIAAFLKKIEMLASESKVNLIKVSPSEAKQRKGYMEYYADLECDGHLEDIAKFIYAINTSPDLLKIVKLSINPKKAGSEDMSAVLQVTKLIVNASSTEEVENLTKKSAGNDLTRQDSSDITGELKDNKANSKSSEEGAVDSKMENTKDKAQTQNNQAESAEEDKPSVWEKSIDKKAKK